METKNKTAVTPQNTDVEKLLELVDRRLSVYVSEFRLRVLNAIGRIVNDGQSVVNVVDEFLKEDPKHAFDEKLLSRSYLPFTDFDIEVQRSVLASLIDTAAAEVESRDRIRSGALDFEKALELFTVKEKFSILIVWAAMGLDGVNISEYSQAIERLILNKRKAILAEVRTLDDDRMNFLCGIVDAGFNIG